MLASTFLWIVHWIVWPSFVINYPILYKRMPSFHGLAHSHGVEIQLVYSCVMPSLRLARRANCDATTCAPRTSRRRPAGCMLLSVVSPLDVELPFSAYIHSVYVTDLGVGTNKAWTKSELRVFAHSFDTRYNVVTMCTVGRRFAVCSIKSRCRRPSLPLALWDVGRRRMDSS